jgi:hypothetical protein
MNLPLKIDCVAAVGLLLATAVAQSSEACTRILYEVDLEKLSLAVGAHPMKLDLSDNRILSGEVSAQFEPAEPFQFLSH